MSGYTVPRVTLLTLLHRTCTGISSVPHSRPIDTPTSFHTQVGTLLHVFHNSYDSALQTYLIEDFCFQEYFYI